METARAVATRAYKTCQPRPEPLLTYGLTHSSIKVFIVSFQAKAATNPKPAVAKVNSCFIKAT